jgi:phytoene dehydrogenase-like protein
MKLSGWDTLIIGAGIGGLTAAAKLVKAGLRVLVLERNPHPGGTAYVYQRRGFSFPMGPLGFSNPGVVNEILKRCGGREELSFDRIHFHLRAFDLNLPLSLPFSEMVGAFTKHFPSDGDAVSQFFEDVENTTMSRQSTSDGDRARRQKMLEQMAAEDYLRASIKDRSLRRILGSLGTREPTSSFSLQAAMWRLMSEEGIWYPRGGMRLFCEMLTRRVDEVQGKEEKIGDLENKEIKNESLGSIHGQVGWIPRLPALGRGGEESRPYNQIYISRKPRPVGGELHLRREVDRIRIMNGRISGIVLKDGTEIESSSVISNADYKTTFLKLINRDVLPEKWYRAVSEARQTGSVLQVCLGVHEKKVDLSAFAHASRLIYRRSREANLGNEEMDWTVNEVDAGVLAGQELEITLWSRDDRMLAPPDGAIIVIRTEVPYSHFSRYRVGFRKRSSEYVNYKTRLGQALVREVTHLLPGLDGAIIVMDVATPLTFEDQGGRSEGAVAGWSWDYDDFRDSQPRELIRTPIRGLFMAGYQAFSGLFMGGVPTAMESGLRAAHAVLEGAGPTDEVLIPSKP